MRESSSPAIQVISDAIGAGQKAGGTSIIRPYPEAPSWDMHQAFEVIVVLAGRLRVFVQGLESSLDPGDLVLTPAWEPHGRCAASPEGADLLVLLFLPGFLGDEDLVGIPWLDMFMAPSADRPRVATDEMRRDVLAIATKLQREVKAQEDGWLTALRLGLLQLLFTVGRKTWRTQRTPARPVRSSDLARLAPAINLVASRIDRHPSVTEAAAVCSISASRFAFVFRHTMGISYGRFVLRSRLGRGAQMLLGTDLPLSTIAQTLGFCDASHFHHSFVRQYGRTPAAYRAGANGNDSEAEGGDEGLL